MAVFARTKPGSHVGLAGLGIVVQAARVLLLAAMLGIMRRRRASFLRALGPLFAVACVLAGIVALFAGRWWLATGLGACAIALYLAAPKADPALLAEFSERYAPEQKKDTESRKQ